MAQYCSTDCGSLTFPDGYGPIDPCDPPESRSCCVNRIGFVTCDSDAQPVSISDPADLLALKTANKLITFSDVGVTFNTPTSTLYTKPCGEEIVVRKEQLIDVEVFTMSTTHLDEVFFRDFCAMNGKFGFIYQTEDGYTYLSKEYADWFLAGAIGALPDMQMGIPCTFSIDPYNPPFNKDEPCRWRFQIKTLFNCVLVGVNAPGFVGVL